MATTAKPHRFLVLKQTLEVLLMLVRVLEFVIQLNIGLILQGITPYPKVKMIYDCPIFAQNATNKIKKNCNRIYIDNIWF